MSHHNTEDVLKHIKVYIAVFIALAILTVVTVWASHFQVSSGAHVAIALTIASIKGGLVAAYFMHLITETRLIYSILAITAFLFLAMILITYFSVMTAGPRVPSIF